MNLKSKASRVLAGALAAVTISTTVAVSPPAQAGDPFTWALHTSGSIWSRIGHGIVGIGLVAAGTTAIVFGGFISLFGIGAPVGVPLMIAGALVTGFGASMMYGVSGNKNVGSVWGGMLSHLIPGHGGGSNVPRSSASGPLRVGAAGSPGPGLGQSR